LVLKRQQRRASTGIGEMALAIRVAECEFQASSCDGPEMRGAKGPHGIQVKIFFMLPADFCGYFCGK
jgi:hypothetical protein